MEILFLVGMAWAVSEAWKAYAPRLALARTNGRARAVKRGGTHNTEGVRRRAARQATAGFWAGELRHGFPTARHGFEAGWAQHRDLMVRGEAERAKRKADQAHEHTKLRAQIAEHWKRLEAARPRPTMSEQLVTDVDAARRGKQAPPLPADGVRPADDAGSYSPRDWRWYGWRAAQEHDDGGDENRDRSEERYWEKFCPACGTSPCAWDGQPDGFHTEAGPETTTGGSGVAGDSDFNYEQTLKTAEEAMDAAEQGVNVPAIEKLRHLEDALSAMLHGDAESAGLAGEASEHAKQIKDHAAQLMDTLGRFKERIVKNYGQQWEGVQSSDADAPEREFMTS